jgi:hypothetical protein
MGISKSCIFIKSNVPKSTVGSDPKHVACVDTSAGARTASHKDCHGIGASWHMLRELFHGVVVPGPLLWRAVLLVTTLKTATQNPDPGSSKSLVQTRHISIANDGIAADGLRKQTRR